MQEMIPGQGFDKIHHDMIELIKQNTGKVNFLVSQAQTEQAQTRQLTPAEKLNEIRKNSVNVGNERPNIVDRTSINIYAGTGENAELSNFAIRPFTIYVETPSGEKQFTFQSVEQGFHFYKTIVANRPDIGKKILSTTNGATLKALTNRSNLPMTSEQIKEWDNTSKSVMLNLMYDSFLQNPQAAKKLLNTGNAVLTHKAYGKEQDNGRFSEVITTVREMLQDDNVTSNKSNVVNRTSIKGMETTADISEITGLSELKDFESRNNLTNFAIEAFECK